MNAKSLRKRKSVLNRISSMHKKNIVSPDKEAIYDIYDEYIDSAPFTPEEMIDFYELMDAILVTNVKDYLEPRIAANTITNTEAEDIIFAQPFEDVRGRLWSMLDTLILQYRGPVVALADIVADGQNVHIPSILKKTTDSVLLLSKVPVPADQKTLSEIHAEFERVLIRPQIFALSEILTHYATHLDEYEKCPEELKNLLSQEYERILREPTIYISSGNVQKVVKCPEIKNIYYLYNGVTKGDAEEEEAEADEEVEAEEADAPTMLNYLSPYFYRINEDIRDNIWDHFFEQEWNRTEKMKKEINTVIADMRDWGNRKAVMNPDKNLYKSTVRGLWVKIKESPFRTELVKRLYEEATEAVGLCADGHVGRMCNVLVGFDPEFTSSLSPKEYFQNNIALISENIHSSLQAKIQQAKALMDEIGMPEEERQAWLDAF